MKKFMEEGEGLCVTDWWTMCVLSLHLASQASQSMQHKHQQSTIYYSLLSHHYPDNQGTEYNLLVKDYRWKQNHIKITFLG